MSSKSMVIRMRKFLFLVESECKDLPTIQLKAMALRWDLEKLFKFPKDAILTSAMHSDGEGRGSDNWSKEDELAETEGLYER